MEKTLTSIMGQKYIQNGCPEGWASYHFDYPIFNPNTDNLQNQIGGSYICYKDSPWNLDDGSAPPEKKYFVNPQYDDQSRVFQGQILWSEVTFGNSYKWEYKMIFSEDFKIIEGGYCKVYNQDDYIQEHEYNYQLYYTVAPQPSAAPYED